MVSCIKLLYNLGSAVSLFCSRIYFFCSSNTSGTLGQICGSRELFCIFSVGQYFISVTIGTIGTPPLVVPETFQHPWARVCLQVSISALVRLLHPYKIIYLSFDKEIKQEYGMKRVEIGLVLFF